MYIPGVVLKYRYVVLNFERKKNLRSPEQRCFRYPSPRSAVRREYLKVSVGSKMEAAQEIDICK